MSKDTIALYQEAVEALRSQARAVPAAIQAMQDANMKVYSSIQSVNGDGGPHTEEILEIVSSIQKELVYVQEVVENIPSMLNNKAEKIEEILNRKYNV